MSFFVEKLGQLPDEMEQYASGPIGELETQRHGQKPKQKNAPQQQQRPQQHAAKAAPAKEQPKKEEKPKKKGWF